MGLIERMVILTGHDEIYADDLSELLQATWGHTPVKLR